MKKLLLGILVIAALLMNVAPASANGLYFLGNTANDSSTSGFISMVTDPVGNPVVFDPLYTGNTFPSNAIATTRYPFSQVIDPGQAVTFSMGGSGYFEANGLTDPEPMVTTQVTAATIGINGGNALAQAVFFQPFLLTATNLPYTYDFLTGVSATYFPGFPDAAASGYSKARYDLGWWDPNTGAFVPGQFVESIQIATIGMSDVNVGLQGQLQYVFGVAPIIIGPLPALPTFSAYSESYAQIDGVGFAPVPSALLLLGSGLACLAGYGRKTSVRK